MFPKKIFQTWKEKEISNEVLKTWKQSWIEKNPTYEYVLWDDADNREFIKEHFPSFLSIYDSYDKNIKRVDAVRYFYLYKYGGIYADLDFICLKPFDVVLETQADVLFGKLGEMDTPKYVLHNIPNAIMIAKPNSDFFKFVISVLQNIGNVSDLDVEVATGPIFLKFCIDHYLTKSKENNPYVEAVYGRNAFDVENVQFDSVIGFAEPEVFYPINWDNKKHDVYRSKLSSNSELEQMFPNSYALTYWMHSWG